MSPLLAITILGVINDGQLHAMFLDDGSDDGDDDYGEDAEIDEPFALLVAWWML